MQGLMIRIAANTTSVSKSSSESSKESKKKKQTKVLEKLEIELPELNVDEE